ncbi:hypothetical protein ACFL35_04550 [Candidatus Riflebacteria bacterium]
METTRKELDLNPRIMAPLFYSFLPLLVFVVVDECFQNLTLSMVTALLCGAVESFYIYKTQGIVDKFILLDVFLIALFSLLSYLKGDEVFFKLKPALLELVMCLFLMPMFFYPQLLKGWVGRYMKGMVPLEGPALFMMSRLLLFFMGVLFVHGLITAYAAVYLSRKTWLFISGPLLYIFFAILMLATFLFNRWKMKKVKVPRVMVKLFFMDKRENILVDTLNSCTPFRTETILGAQDILKLNNFKNEEEMFSFIQEKGAPGLDSLLTEASRDYGPFRLHETLGFSYHQEKSIFQIFFLAIGKKPKELKEGIAFIKTKSSQKFLGEDFNELENLLNG